MKIANPGLAALVIACVGSASGAFPLSLRETVELVLKGKPARGIKGEVVRENLKGILLKGEGDPAMLPWAEIESVNGRPVRERVARFKETQKDALCPDCRGGLVTLLCPDCLATGKTYNRSKPCEKCGGAGAGGAPCTAKGCDKGKIECPGRCLKRSVGVWREVPGLGLSRIFYVKLSELRQGEPHVSTKHLGQIIEFKEAEPFALVNCPKCKGVAKIPCKDCKEAGTFIQKRPEILGDCEICGGVGKGAGLANCPVCMGMGTLPCEVCLSAKMVPVPESAVACASCKEGIVRCATCLETGLYDPKASAVRAPGFLPLPASINNMRPLLRKALAQIDEVPPVSTDRVTLRDGRTLEGCVIQRLFTGIIFGIRPASGGDLRVLVVSNKSGFRQERLATPSASPAPAEEKKPAPAPADPAARPAPGPDTVVLKDGTTVNGKIVGRSDEAILLKTPEGKMVKIEADKVAEIRSQPKK